MPYAHPFLHSIALLVICASLACAIVVSIDLLRHPQKMWIMDLVWPLTMLYLGPLGLWIYWRMGRAGGGGEPSSWQAALKGSLHCGAGCTVGDFAGEWLVFLLGVTVLGSDLLAKYLLAFVLAYGFGIFFQYFTIAPMRHLSPGPGIAAALKADTLSLIAFEVGMFVWMAVTQKLLLPGIKPTSVEYWFMMQLAMILGLITTFPVNVWLLHKGWKERM